MARKYLRGLQYTTGTNGRDIPIFMRICYEFWGYCVNGTSSLTTPGGMPTTPTSGPANFFEGASVLATGNDGVTHDLGINFDSPSANFNTSLIGKYITIWSTTDPDSTDNSIYQILNVPSPTQLIIAPFSGGTPDITTMKNNLTSRSALNYRIIDVVAASQLAIANGNYFVCTLSGASTINTGQANSQFQFFLRGASAIFGNFSISASPGGTWTGAAFTGSTIDRSTAQVAIGSNFFTGTTLGANGSISLIADKDFFIGHIRSPNATTGMYFYVLVPQRIYTQAQDPNPITVLTGANGLTCGTGNDSHSNSFFMLDNAGSPVSRACQLITKNFVGDGTVGTAYTMGPNLSGVLVTQSRLGKILYSDAIISNVAIAGQFALTRGKMRPIAFSSSALPSFHLVGDNGEFIHVGNGVLWPWDGAVLPYNLLPLGT